MDSAAILDQLIRTGKELANKGQDAVESLAEDKLNLPEAGPERDEALSNAGKGAAAAAALMLLLGTKGGRALSGAALKLGSLAALGGVAYKTYRDWEAKNALDSDQPAGVPVGELTGDSANARSAHLLQAMVSAASSDNEVSAQEREKIMQRFSAASAGEDFHGIFQQTLERPLNIAEIAKEVDSPTYAAEVYLACASMLDSSSRADQAYLKQLAEALELAPELATDLSSQVWEAA